MAISVLYLNERNLKSESTSERILYNLSLDRSFSYICADVKKRNYFLSVISNLSDDKNEILYRQEVLKDFENNPTLLDQFLSLSARFEELRVAQKNVGKEGYRLNATATTSSSASASKNILGAQSLCLKRALLFIKTYGDLLSKHDLKSNGLTSLLSACKEIYENPEYLKLITICSKYENFSASGFWDFKFTFNDEGRIEEYALIDHRYIHVTDSDKKKKGFSLFKKADETIYSCTRVNPSQDKFFESLAIASFSELSKLFASISEQIFSRFISTHN